MSQDNPNQSANAAAQAHKRRLDDVVHFASETVNERAPAPQIVPWALQHYFDGEIDLIKELAGRFPQVPVMSLIHTRQVGTKTRRGVATLSTQDGAASVVVEIDAPSQAMQFTFVHSSMLSLRFLLGRLSAADRAQWLEPMRRETGEAAFLWDQSRWSSDYVISAAQRNFTNLYAFSPQQIEASARLTPEVTRKLLDWLEFYWNDAAP
ncbi:MAG: hypothetical protein ABI835_20195 [Chloroflexota bacterium]